MGWVTEHAPRPAELAACIQCGLCLPGCPTYRLTGDETASPRGRLTAMSAVAAGVAEVDETFADIMGFCLQCRACEPACPSLVPFGRAMEGARAEIAAQLPSRARRARHRALGRAGLGSQGKVGAATRLAALGQRLGAPRWLPGRVGRGYAGLRRLETSPASTRGFEWAPFGDQRGVAGLLAGCVMDPWFPDVHRATVAVLRAAGYRVVVPEEQACCGALAAHDGAAAETEELGALNAAAFERVDVVVADAAGCGAHLKDIAGPDGTPVADITEVAADALAAGVLPTLPARGEQVAVQDPCHLRHAQRIVEQPRAVLRAAGYEVVEIDPGGMCCGAAGLYSLAYPETSRQLGQRKAEQVAVTGVKLVASANPGCEMQLRSHLPPGYRIAHPIELYAQATGLV